MVSWSGKEGKLRRSRPKPGHSGRTGPKEKAGEPLLASSQLLYRTDLQGPPIRLLQPPPHQVSGRQLWHTGNCTSLQLPPSPHLLL